MRKEDFKLGESVQLNTYSYDDQGNEYTREVKGKVCQITNSFIVLDNGNYKESFKYSPKRLLEVFPSKVKTLENAENVLLVQ